MSPSPHWARSACVSVKFELLSCFDLFLAPVTSCPSRSPVSFDSYEHSHVLETRPFDRRGSSPPVIGFFCPPSHLWFIIYTACVFNQCSSSFNSSFKQLTANIVKKCKKKCFITMGRVKPLIMHGNMLVKRECIYFCGKCWCFGGILGARCWYLHYWVVFCLNLHSLKLYIRSHEDFFSFIRVVHHHMSQTFNMQIKHLMHGLPPRSGGSSFLISFLPQIKHNISI